MPNVTFGRYAVRDEQFLPGERVLLDGCDGFDDQSLSDVEVGTSLRFVADGLTGFWGDIRGCRARGCPGEHAMPLEWSRRFVDAIGRCPLVTATITVADEICAEAEVASACPLADVLVGKPWDDKDAQRQLLLERDGHPDLWVEACSLPCIAQVEAAERDGFSVSVGVVGFHCRVLSVVRVADGLRVLSLGGNYLEGSFIYDIGSSARFAQELTRMQADQGGKGRVFWSRLAGT